MLKSLMTGPPFNRCSSSATRAWGDWFGTTDSPFPLSASVLGTCPTNYYIRFDSAFSTRRQAVMVIVLRRSALQDPFPRRQKVYSATVLIKPKGHESKLKKMDHGAVQLRRHALFALYARRQFAAPTMLAICVDAL